MSNANSDRLRTERMSYGVDEAAELLGVSRTLVYDLMVSRKLAYAKLGRRRVIPREALEALLAESTE